MRTSAKRIRFIDWREPVGADGRHRFQVEVADLDATWRELRDAGVSSRGDIVEGRAGRQGLVLDPSGNPVKLFEPAPR